MRMAASLGVHQAQSEKALDSVVATWVFCDAEGAESKYPQVNGRSSTEAFQAVYWHCAFVSLASARLHNPMARLILFSNLDLSEAVNRNSALPDLLSRFEIEYVAIQAMHTVPNGWFGTWRNQFFVFDVLKWCTEHLSAHSCLVLTDGDCLWRESGQAMFDDIDDNGAVTYVIDYPEDKLVNGLTRVNLAQISRRLGYDVDESIEYCGGELIALRADVAVDLVAEFERVWPLLLLAHRDCELKFNEEAQLLSSLYVGLGLRPHSANTYVKRMWTALRYTNLAADDMDLMIWHLPAEKEFGFARAFSALMTRREASAEQLSARLESCFDVRTRRTMRRLRDDARRVLKALLRQVS